MSAERRSEGLSRQTLSGKQQQSLSHAIAIYDGNTQLAKGDNTTARYTADKMTAGRTFTAKVIDANGAVQKDGSGADLAKNVEIGVKTGFFAKIAAFFRAIFGLLPMISIQP